MQHCYIQLYQQYFTSTEGRGPVTVDCSIIGIIESMASAVDSGAYGRVQASTPAKSIAARGAIQSP